MTVQELYQSIGGDYDSAVKIMRMDKLIDRHIRKFVKSDLPDKLAAASEELDPTAMFEASHALKGVSANLGLNSLSAVASDLAEEFRPGNARKMSDDEVRAKAAEAVEICRKTVDGIRAYEEAQG